MILECKREATRQELIDRCNYLQEELDRVTREKDLHIKLEQQYKKEYLELKEEVKKLKEIELKAKGGGIKITLEGLLEIEKKMLELENIIEAMAEVIDSSEGIGLAYCTKMSHLNDNYCSIRNCTDCVIEYFEKQIQNK